MLGNLGFSEIMLILLVCLLFFGAGRLPEIGSSIGKGIREFKRSLSEVADPLPPAQSNQPGSAPRQLDAPPAQPTGGEPKRLSQ